MMRSVVGDRRDISRARVRKRFEIFSTNKVHIFKTNPPHTHTPTRRPKTKDADERNTTMAPRVVPYSHIITKEMMNVWDVKDFSLKLAKNVLLWEIPRAFASVAISRARRNEPQTAKEKTFVATAPAYVMSAVHAVVVAYIGAKIGWEALALKETRDQYYLNKKTAMTMESLRFTELGNWAFCGYMTGDLLHVLAEYPRLGKMDTVVHHLCFVACSLLAGHSQTMILPFSWLLIGEFSTPLLCHAMVRAAIHVRTREREDYRRRQGFGF
jgi:hypothetical protein